MKIVITQRISGKSLILRRWVIAMTISQERRSLARRCHRNYGFDSASYFTAPGLTWDAALKVTNGELKL